MFYWIELGSVHTKDMGNVINVFQQALHLGFVYVYFVVCDPFDKKVNCRPCESVRDG